MTMTDQDQSPVVMQEAVLGLDTPELRRSLDLDVRWAIRDTVSGDCLKAVGPDQGLSGSRIEHGLMRFYLAACREGDDRFMVSGDTALDREVEANAELALSPEYDEGRPIALDEVTELRRASDPGLNALNVIRELSLAPIIISKDGKLVLVKFGMVTT